MESGDESFMREALKLARRGVGRTSPNPAVGAVVVAGGRIVGRGFHPRAGEPHAEVFALDEAGEAARGATLYVTLEPCCHTGRTPPCTDRILEAGIGRVVYAIGDPNPRVSGGGRRVLEAAGVAVEHGLLEGPARRLNEPFFHHVVTGRPLVTLKFAMSLDGRLAAPDGTSHWITSLAARREGHKLRDELDAILVGVGTVLADDPQLTCRIPGKKTRNPVRVVLDSDLRTPPASRVLHTESAPTLVITANGADPSKVEAIKRTGSEVIEVSRGAGGVDVNQVLQVLGARGMTSLLVEGGATVAASFLRAGVAARVVAFIAPTLIGGGPRYQAVGDIGIGTLADALKLKDVTFRKIGGDLRVEGRIRDR